MSDIGVVFVMAEAIAACIISFCIGRNAADMASGEEAGEAPAKRSRALKLKTPAQIYREHVEKKANEAELAKVEAILSNIDKYDGTDRGQEDIPGR